MGFQGLKGLSELFLASTRAAKAAGAWTFLIKILMNFWKRSLFGRTIETRVRAGLGPGKSLRPGGAEPRLGRFKADLPQYTKGIVKKQRQSGE